MIEVYITVMSLDVSEYLLSREVTSGSNGCWGLITYTHLSVFKLYRNMNSVFGHDLLRFIIDQLAFYERQ